MERKDKEEMMKERVFYVWKRQRVIKEKKLKINY
jgi:hypothetical protein